MAVKSVNAAPAAKTPFLITSQLGGSSTFHIFLYCVWYAFLIDAASKHISAIKKNTLQHNHFSLFQINCFEKNPIQRLYRMDGWLPANEEENNGTSSWTARVKRLSTTEATTSSHNKDLAYKEKNKCTSSITCSNVSTIHTVIILLVSVCFNLALSKQRLLQDMNRVKKNISRNHISDTYKIWIWSKHITSSLANHLFQCGYSQHLSRMWNFNNTVLLRNFYTHYNVMLCINSRSWIETMHLDLQIQVESDITFQLNANYSLIFQFTIHLLNRKQDCESDLIKHFKIQRSHRFRELELDFELLIEWSFANTNREILSESQIEIEQKRNSMKQRRREESMNLRHFFSARRQWLTQRRWDRG